MMAHLLHAIAVSRFPILSVLVLSVAVAMAAGGKTRLIPQPQLDAFQMSGFGPRGHRQIRSDQIDEPP
jgi:hypothetical protein